MPVNMLSTYRGQTEGLHRIYLVEVDTHALQLELRCAVVAASGSVPGDKHSRWKAKGNIQSIAVEAMLARDSLPESWLISLGKSDGDQ